VRFGESWDAAKDLFTQRPAQEAMPEPEPPPEPEVEEPPPEPEYTGHEEETPEGFWPEEHHRDGQSNEYGEVWSEMDGGWVSRNHYDYWEDARQEWMAQREDNLALNRRQNSQVQKAYQGLELVKQAGQEGLLEGQVRDKWELTGKLHQALDKLYQQEMAIGLEDSRRELIADLRSRVSDLESSLDHGDAYRQADEIRQILIRQFELRPGEVPSYTYTQAVVDTTLQAGAMALDATLTRGGASVALNSARTYFSSRASGDSSAVASLKAIGSGAVSYGMGKLGTGAGAMATGVTTTAQALWDGKDPAAALKEGLSAGVLDAGMSKMGGFVHSHLPGGKPRLDAGGASALRDSDAAGALWGGKKGAGGPELEAAAGRGAGKAAQTGEAAAAGPRAGIPEEVTAKLDNLQKNVREVGGKKYARVEDVLEAQKDTRVMRNLKDAPPEMRESFNNTMEQIKRRHDQGLVDDFKKIHPEYKHRKVMVDEFRTPGKSDPGDINTDRDYRLVEVHPLRDHNGKVILDANGQPRVEHIEIPREKWEHLSPDNFRKATGQTRAQFEAAKAQIRSGLDEAGQKKFDQLPAHEQNKKVMESYGWEATDRSHIEASRAGSDQVHRVEEVRQADGALKRKVVVGQEESSLKRAKAGRGFLEDHAGEGLKWKEKVTMHLRADNKPEAVAQLKKGVVELEQIRAGYRQQDTDVGELRDSGFAKGMELVKRHGDQAAKGDVRAMADFEGGLKKLGFRGGIEDFTDKLASQYESLKLDPKVKDAYFRRLDQKGG
jgi:hypothetical protein